MQDPKRIKTILTAEVGFDLVRDDGMRPESVGPGRGRPLPSLAGVSAPTPFTFASKNGKHTINDTLHHTLHRLH